MAILSLRPCWCLRVAIHGLSVHWYVVGVTGSAPKTFPRNVWLRDIMESVFDDKTVYKNFSDQLDAFAVRMDWSPRSNDEKTNNLADPSKDPFLKGVQAVLELYFYGIPLTTVFSCSFAGA
jgi:hypothetical protein